MTDLERLFRRLVDNLIAIDPARLHRPVPLAELLGSIIPYRTTRRALNVDSAEDYDSLVLRLCAGEGGFVRMVSDDITQVFQDQLSSPNPDLSVLKEHGRAELLLGTEPLAHALGPGPEEAYAPPEPDTDLLDLPSVSERRGKEARTPPPPSVASPESDSSDSAEATRRRGDVATGRRQADPPSNEIRLDTYRPMSFTAEPTPAPTPTPPMVPPPPRITPELDEPIGRRRGESGPRCSYCGGRLPTGRAVNFCPHCGENQAFVRCPECQAELELGWRHCISCGHVVGDA